MIKKEPNLPNLRTLYVYWKESKPWRCYQCSELHEENHDDSDSLLNKKEGEEETDTQRENEREILVHAETFRRNPERFRRPPDRYHAAGFS